MGNLHRNLDVIRNRDPDLALRIDAAVQDDTLESLQSASGAITLSVDGRLEASAEDPEREGEAFAAHFLERAQDASATRIVLFGMGVHTLRYLSEFTGKILVIEPSLAFCKAVLTSIDLSEFLSRHEIVVTEDPARVLSHATFGGEELGVFVQHPTARRRHGKFHDYLAQRFSAGGVPSPYDIAVIPPIWGGSLPIAHACARAFRVMGHRVREVDFSPYLPAYQELQRVTADSRLSGASDALRQGLSRVLGESLVASFHLDPPDLVFALAQAPLDTETLQKFANMDITRAFWFCEDYHVMSYWQAIAPLYDVFFHVQPGDFDGMLRDAGAYGFHLPMGTDPEVSRPIELTHDQQQRYGSDLSFLGAGYHNRREFLPGLIDQGLRIYGTEWPHTSPFLEVMPEPNARQSPDDSNIIFNATKVNINLHSSPWCDGVNPAGDYLNPRTFELASARAFQLVDKRQHLELSFNPGLEVETFKDLGECRKKAAYYLQHPSERCDIADNAYRRALAEHTYGHRMEVALDALRSSPRPLAARQKPLPTAAALVLDAKDEPGLRAIAARIPGDRIMDNDAITLALRSGDGELTEDERILLFMQETLVELEFLSDAGKAS